MSAAVIWNNVPISKSNNTLSWFVITQAVLCKLQLQSIYVTRDGVILKFEARVQIYVAVLNFGYEIQNSSGEVVRFPKINSYEIPFWLFLFKNMRNIRSLDVWWHYFALNSRISGGDICRGMFNIPLERWKLSRGFRMLISVSQLRSRVT